MAKRAPAPEPTDPGDTIEISVTAEVKGRKGQSFWAKAGATSTHRDGETSQEAADRITDFVLDQVEQLTSEFLS